jgi:hypothetical protein
MTRIKQYDPEWIAELQAHIDPVLEEAKARREARSQEEEDRLMRELMDEPIDPDIELISAFLTLDMPAEEMVKVEDRLANDAEFRQKCAPLIWLWDTPISFTPPSERNAPRTPPPPPPMSDRVGEPIDFVEAGPVRRRMRLIIIGAIVVPIIIGLFGWWGVRVVTRQFKGMIGTTAAIQGKQALTINFKNPVVHVATIDPLIVEPRPGIKLELSPHSQFTVADSTAGKGSLWPLGALDGDMIIDISPQHTNVAIRTYASIAFVLGPGRYAIHSPPGAAETLVTIAPGSAYRPVGDSTITSGHVAIKQVTYRIPTDTAGFPKLPRAK